MTTRKNSIKDLINFYEKTYGSSGNGGGGGGGGSSRTTTDENLMNKILPSSKSVPYDNTPTGAKLRFTPQRSQPLQTNYNIYNQPQLTHQQHQPRSFSISQSLSSSTSSTSSSSTGSVLEINNTDCAPNRRSSIVGVPKSPTVLVAPEVDKHTAVIVSNIEEDQPKPETVLPTQQPPQQQQQQQPAIVSPPVYNGVGVMHKSNLCRRKFQSFNVPAAVKHSYIISPNHNFHRKYPTTTAKIRLLSSSLLNCDNIKVFKR